MAVDEISVGGLGARVKRVEDDRFIRGKGNYTDDFKLPRMLHMEILRSPHAHARYRVDRHRKAWAIPGVHLVITGELMAQHNLAWMPTLSYDTQAVLATDKVRFQGQEVAAVVADDPYIAKDACELIDVEYDPLPAIVNPMQAVAPDAPLIRDDKDGPEGQHLLHLGGGRQGEDRPCLRTRPTRWSSSTVLPPLAPLPHRVLRLHRRLQPGHRPSSRST